VNPIRIDNWIILFYGNRAGRVEDGCAEVDPMFRGQELSGFLGRSHVKGAGTLRLSGETAPYT